MMAQGGSLFRPRERPTRLHRIQLLLHCYYIVVYVFVLFVSLLLLYVSLYVDCLFLDFWLHRTQTGRGRGHGRISLVIIAGNVCASILRFVVCSLIRTIAILALQLLNYQPTCPHLQMHRPPCSCFNIS